MPRTRLCRAIEEGAMVVRRSVKAAMLSGAALGAIALGTVPAQAGGFYLHEQSAYFQGTSMAGAAAGGPSLSSMFWNPATITQQGLGLASETSGAVIFTRSNITPTLATTATGTNITALGSSGDLGKDAFVPSSYYTYGLNNWVSFGLGINVPFGLRTEPNPLWAGLFYSAESEVVTINFNPSVAFKLTDWLSIGVGLQAQWFKVKLDSAFPGSGTFPPFGALLPQQLRIDGNGWDFGFTAGVTITPTAWTTIGLGYRSQIDQKIDGDIFRPQFLLPVGAALINIPAAFVNFEATVPLPDIATASIRQKVTEQITLLGTVEWTNWSRLGTIPVTVTSTPVVPPGIPPTLNFGWRDGWMFSGGAEYQWSPTLALRGGIAWEISPITDATRGTRLPDKDRFWLSAGASYQWSDKLSFDFGYSHLFIDDAQINLVPGNPTFNPSLGTFIGTANGQVDIFSAALRYRWLPPAPAPLITKG